MSGFSVARKSDRHRMADEVERVAAAVPGWAFIRMNEDHPDQFRGPRCVSVDLVGPHGLSLGVDFDGDSKQQREGVFVLSWHGVRDPHKLARHFAPSVNEYHWQKATDVAESFQELLEIVAKRMASATDGSAFQ